MANGWICLVAPKQLIERLPQEHFEMFEGEITSEVENDSVELLRAEHSDVRGTGEFAELFGILRDKRIPYNVEYGALGENNDCYGTEYVRYVESGEPIVHDVPFADGKPRVLLSDLLEAMQRGQNALIDLVNLERDEKTIQSWDNSISLR